jgi:LysM repeat protein
MNPNTLLRGVKEMWFKHFTCVLLAILVPTVSSYAVDYGLKSSLGQISAVRGESAYADTNLIRVFQDKRVLCEYYMVKKGDRIWDILDKKIHGSVSQIIHWSRVLQTLNPEVANLDLIHPGQRLLVPLGFLKGAESHRTETSRDRRTTIYEVKRGDSLSEILSNHFHYPEHLIFNEAINAVEELNPNIENLNQLKPGQRIVIPMSVPIGSPSTADTTAQAEVGAPTVPATTSEPPGRGSTQEVKGELTANKLADLADSIKEKRMLEERGVGDTADQEIIETVSNNRLVSPPTPGERQRQVLAEAVIATVVALGGKGSNKGLYSLPIGGQGEITLESNLFPLVEFPSGESMFLDLNDRLPSQLAGAIHTVWDDRYRIVKIREKDNFRSIWQRLIEQLDKMEVWNKREPLIIRTPLPISIQGDWILTATGPQVSRGKIFIVNLLKDAEERTDPALQTYLDSLGIRVVDVQLGGQLEQARVTPPMNEQAFNASANTVIVRSRYVPDLVEAFLKVLGQPYQRGKRVRFGTETNEGFSLTISVDFYFKRDGAFHLIDFQRLSPSILDLLKQWHYQVLVVDPEWDASQVFRALEEHLKLKSVNSYNTFVSRREPNRNIHLSIPGEVIREGKRSQLITPMVLPAPLTDFLQRQDFSVLTHQTR